MQISLEEDCHTTILTGVRVEGDSAGINVSDESLCGSCIVVMGILSE